MENMQKSCSTDETDESKMRKVVLELGTRLANELNDVSSPSITANWMSWHLAEVMTAAKTNPSRVQECAELILKLWRARRFLPAGDPFERYEKVLSALETVLESKPEFFVFGLFRPRRQNLDDQNLAELAMEVRRCGHILSLNALRVAAERQGLGHDDLLRLAHEIDPDAQTTTLRLAQRLVQETGSEGDSTRDEQHVREALEALQELIATYRRTYDNLTTGEIDE